MLHGKRVVATAMSALMIASSLPVTAFAEQADQTPGTASAAVSAGLDPSAAGASDLRAALDETAGTKADSAEGATEAQGAAKTSDASKAKGEATSSATSDASKGATAKASSPATAEAPANGAASGAAGDQAAAVDSAAADSTATAANATPKANATEPPACNPSDYENNVGYVSYVVLDANGKQVCSGSTTVKSAGGMTLVSGPAEEGGKWVAHATLDASKVNLADFAPNWAVKNPEKYALDTSSSKLTLELRTNSLSEYATTYSASGSGRASLVFREKTAEPTLEAADSLTLSQSQLAATGSVYTLAGVSAKDAEGAAVADSEVDYAISDADGKTYAAGDWLRASTAPGTYAITWTYAGITKTTTVTVTASYTLEAPATANVTEEQIAGFTHGKTDLAKAVLTRAVDEQGNDVADQVQVDITDEKGGYVSYKRFTLAPEGSTFNVTFSLGTAKATTKVTIGEAKPTAPAFDAQVALNKANAVTVRVDSGTGLGYVDQTFTYVSADDVAKLVTNQTDPAQDSKGNWFVTLTLDPDAVKTKVNLSIGDDYVLDADNSKLTVTFETNGAAGTSWYIKTGDYARVLFKKQVPAKADLHVFGTNPEYPTTSFLTLSDDIHVGDKVLGVKGLTDPAATGWKFEGWYLDAAYTQPVDENTVVGSSWFAIYAKWTRTSTYALEAKASAEYTPDEAKAAFGYTGSYKNGEAKLRAALVTKAQTDGEDVDLTADDVKVDVWKSGGNGFFDLVAGKEGTYTVDFTLGDQKVTTTVTVKEAEPVQATVQVNLNDGVDSGTAVVGTVGQKLSDLEGLDAKYKNPTRPGYTFLGYSNNVNDEVEKDPTITAAFEVFTAQWEADQQPTLTTERDEATLSVSQIKGLEDDAQADALRKAFGVKAMAADGSDATASVRASSINQATTQQGYFDLLAGTPGTYTIVFTFDAANDLSKTVTLTVKPDDATTPGTDEGEGGTTKPGTDEGGTTTTPETDGKDAATGSDAAGKGDVTATGSGTEAQAGKESGAAKQAGAAKAKALPQTGDATASPLAGIVAAAGAAVAALGVRLARRGRHDA